MNSFGENWSVSVDSNKGIKAIKSDNKVDESFSKILNEDRIFFSNQRIRDIEYDKNLNVLFIIFEVTPSIGILSLN